MLAVNNCFIVNSVEVSVSITKQPFGELSLWCKYKNLLETICRNHGKENIID